MKKIELKIKSKMDKLFIKDGYVMDYSNSSFKNFILESVEENIYDEKYDRIGDSKGNRLRCFWSEVGIEKVIKLSLDLLDYWDNLDSKKTETDFRSYDVCKEYFEKLLSEGEPFSEKNNDNLSKIQSKTLKSPNVFISYSWDSEEHEEWIETLVNTLRIEDGIDATFDKHQMQKGTINLNRMMVDNIYKNDFVVVVLTENYAKRANDELGGVGAESNSLMEILRVPHEKNKIILLNRHTGDFSSTIPNFLKGLNCIDISNEKLESGYDDLVRRIKNANKYEVPKLGKSRDLAPKEAKKFKFKTAEIIIDNSSHIDIKLYEYIKSQVKEIIEYAYIFDFCTPHLRDTFLNLYKLEWEFKSPEFEFLNEDLEKVKKELEEAIKNFTGNISLETYSSDQRGFQEIPREWRINDPDRFEEALYKINLSSSEMHKKYYNFIRQCRKTFII